MANFDGFLPHEIPRFSSLVEAEDPTNLPLGVSPFLRNVRFHLTGCRTRDGIQSKYGFLLPDKGSVTGLAALKIGRAGLQDLQVPLAFSSLGNLYVEKPAGAGNVTPRATPLLTLPKGASMQEASAYAKTFLAFGDLRNSLGAPAVYNPVLDQLDPLSMKPVGVTWAAATSYQIGEVVTPPTPVGGNGHTYRCVVAGTSGANPPAFSLIAQAQFADGTVTWKENTPQMVQTLVPPFLQSAPPTVRNAGAGAFAANRDVYIICTLVNAQGETNQTGESAFIFVDTSLNDQFTVTGPTLAMQPSWEQALPAQYKPTGYNVYEADVPTGNPAPALTAYLKVNGGPIALGANFNVNNSGAGTALPVLNGALVVPAGNICAGLRYMVVLFVNRNGYISGMSAASVIAANFGTAGYQLYVPYIPTGPSNTIARICAFTPAGTLSQLAGTGISNAGPYFYILPQMPNGIFNLSAAPPGVSVADVVNGVQESSTLINDNVTTSATFNFDDNYLKATLNEVSSYFRKIQVPNCSDIFYSKTLRRMFYAADNLPSGWYVSLQDDPESVYGDVAGIIQAAENNGWNRTAIREFDGQLYLMKEQGGHAVTPNANDPSTWTVTEQWSGSGPCGPRAVDVATEFLCYVHRSGVWIYTGGKPKHISKELPAHTGLTWKNINWSAAQTIWVLIDDETKEVRIGVPYGAGVATPNIVLKCNYEELPDIEVADGSWAPPIHFSPYIGKEIATGACYKWSIDDIPANLAIRAERTLVNPPAGIDQTTVKSQILYASSNPDGAVSAIIPYSFDDNGVGIDSIAETAAPQDLMRPNQLGGVQVNIGGYGQGSVEVLALRAKDLQQGGIDTKGGKPSANAGFVKRLKKPWIAGVPYSCGASGQNERFRLRFSNDKRPGVWFDLKWACIYARPISSARPG